MNSTLPPPDAATYIPPTTETPRPDQQRPHRPGRDRFVRPISGRRIGGVCAAVADRYDWDRTTVRLVTLLSVLLPGPQVIAYLVAWVVMPGEDELGNN